MKNIKENLKYSFLFFLFVLIDQYSKYLIRSSTVVFRNYNFAFSVALPIALIYAVYAVLIFGLIFWFARKQTKSILDKISFVLILAGAVSNVGERVARGYVIDFIHIHTGILNIADFYILLGIALLLFIPENKKVN